VLLYGKAWRRRDEIRREREYAEPGWRAWYRRRLEFRRLFGRELQELDCYTRDLRRTIVRLRRRPIQRYRAWMHGVSARFAFGRTLAGSCVILVLLAAGSSFYEPSWLAGSPASFDAFVLWQAPEGRLLLANWMSASLAILTMPLLYLVRRCILQRRHRQQIRSLEEFAAADPDLLIERQRAETGPSDEAQPPADAGEDGSWPVVLGVVGHMSAAFRALADAETKKLNRAYADALAELRTEDAEAREAYCAA
jgi:hypothetical protein